MQYNKAAGIGVNPLVLIIQLGDSNNDKYMMEKGIFFYGFTQRVLMQPLVSICHSNRPSSVCQWTVSHNR